MAIVPVTGDPAAQPAGDPPSSIRGSVAAITAACGRHQDSLIEILHRLQERHGHLSSAMLAAVAHDLALPPSRVVGVASFYHLFHQAPPPPHRAGVCLGTACWVRGGPVVLAALEQRLGRRAGASPGPDGWALAAIDCLGACGQAPVLAVDGVLLRQLPLADPAALAARFTAAGLPEGPA
ncbi:MAG: NAD(P)H-dependent oxidoreductase subunit E [Cyanobacteriota bacterium]|nr:NAD(P)H-dependent oxidoreductase subunit E [Cyanobacteriota bacterium]